MATTHKLTPHQIANRVIDAHDETLDDLAFTTSQLAMLRNLIEKSIDEYASPDNQRPENLSEACARLGVNLHWKSRGSIARSDWADHRARYFVFIGMPDAPYAAFSTEEQTIADLEQTVGQVTQFGVNVWVEAVL